MVRDRFDRDQHELLVCQLLHIRQTSSASEYVTKFTSLTDQLIAYNSSIDPVYIVTHFFDGLRSELRSILLVQRPKALDAACTLALLQEEASGQRDMPGSTSVMFSKIPRTTMPLPPPPKIDKASSVDGSATTALDSKLVAIKAYRKAMGLCYKCG